MIEYVILEPRGYPHPITSRERELMPSRVYLTQYDQRDGNPFIVNLTGITDRLYHVGTPNISITSTDPADIARIMHLDGVDPHIPLNHAIGAQTTGTIVSNDILSDLMIASAEMHHTTPAIRQAVGGEKNERRQRAIESSGEEVLWANTADIERKNEEEWLTKIGQYEHATERKEEKEEEKIAAITKKADLRNLLTARLSQQA